MKTFAFEVSAEPYDSRTRPNIPSVKTDSRMDNLQRKFGITGAPLKPVCNWQIALGMLVLCGVWLGPLPTLSRTAFSPGMITHLSVVALAGPWIGYGLASLQYPRREFGTPSVLIFVMFCDMAIVLAWHLPDLHEAAARQWTFFAVEQISFLVVSTTVWYLAFENERHAALGAFVMFMIFMHMTILGCALAILPHVIYDPDICRGAFGLGPLKDQRLGGVLMASWGAVAYLIGAILLLNKVIKGDAR